jgi:hypothetical protein
MIEEIVNIERFFVTGSEQSLLRTVNYLLDRDLITKDSFIYHRLNKDVPYKIYWL